MPIGIAKWSNETALALVFTQDNVSFLQPIRADFPVVIRHRRAVG
jgi:hypothetical protein